MVVSYRYRDQALVKSQMNHITEKGKVDMYLM